MAKTPTEIRSLARSHTESAVSTLVNIMQSPQATCAARVSAAQYLLDRGWGKPKEHVEITANAFDGLSDADLSAILAAVRAKDGAGAEDRAGTEPTLN